MILNCPDCHKRLKVPEDAVGKRARCSACRHKFVVPDPVAMNEETIAGWMVEDVEQLHELKAKHQTLYRRLELDREPTPAGGNHTRRPQDRGVGQE